MIERVDSDHYYILVMFNNAQMQTGLKCFQVNLYKFQAVKEIFSCAVIVNFFEYTSNLMLAVHKMPFQRLGFTTFFADNKIKLQTE